MADVETQVNTKADVEKLKADLNQLRADFGELFNTALDLGKDGAGNVKEKLESGVAELKRAAQVAKDKGAQAVDGTEQCIRQRPLLSVAIAFGVGVLVAKLLSIRSRD